jgi:hypothetical protein
MVDKETSLMIRFDDTVAYLTFHGRNSCINHERCPFVDYCKDSFCKNIKTTHAIVNKGTSFMVYGKLRTCVLYKNFETYPKDCSRGKSRKKSENVWECLEKSRKMFAKI